MNLRNGLLLFLSFFVIAAIVYSPSLGGPFQYDDYAQILDNKVLTDRPLPKLLSSIFRFTAHPDGWTGTRDFVRATFLLNWQWWGEKPLGYRWVNLTIHVINAWLVSGLVWLLFQNTQKTLKARKSDKPENQKTGNSGSLNLRLSDNSGSPSPPSFPNFWIAIGAGLLFLVHPLQSQSVAYVAQRFTSVAAMFYLLTVIFYILFIRYRFLQIPLKSSKFLYYSYYLAAILSALLAFNSKEIAVTLPAVLLLVTLAGSREEGKGKRVKGHFLLPSSLFLLPFFVLALKIPFQTATAAARGGESAASTKLDLGAFALRQKEDLISRRDYFLTQISVVGTYLRLAVLPVNQTLDYDYPITKNLDPKTLALAALHLSLIGFAVISLFGYSVIRLFGYSDPSNPSLPSNPSSHSSHSNHSNHLSYRLIGLGILWFYLTLLPESSLIPIPDVIYEHRAYLPMVGLILAAAAAIAAALHKTHESHETHKSHVSYAVVAAALMLILAAATIRRAAVWGSEVRLWADVYAKAPQKPRAVKNYGVVLAASGKYDDGIKLLEKAVKLDPDNADYWSNLGTANLRAGRFDSAKDKFLKAYELLASELKLPDYQAPLDSFASLAPLNSSAKSLKQAAQYLNDYGVCLVQLGRGDEALAAFQKSLAIDPTLYAARLGLGAAYNLQNNIQAATDVFEALVEEYPDQADAYNNLAVMYKKAGRLDDRDRILKAVPKSLK